VSGGFQKQYIYQCSVFVMNNNKNKESWLLQKSACTFTISS